MFCLKLLLCYIMLYNTCVVGMSFTAQYEHYDTNNNTNTNTNTNSNSDSKPAIDAIDETGGPRVSGLTGLTAAVSIQINDPKPRHIHKLQTLLLNITLLTTSIHIKWKFVVITRTRIKRLSTIASVQRQRRSLEWVIKLRQYTTLNVNVYHVRDHNNSIDDIHVHNQTYDYSIKGLKPSTPYELCIHSNHAITDDMHSMVNSWPEGQKAHMICKEIMTSAMSGQPVANIAMASAISSASTTLVIVIMFCCCRRTRTSTHTRPTTTSTDNTCRYQSIWKCLRRSPQRSSYRSESCMSGRDSKLQTTGLILNPVVNSVNTEDFYINANDIKCIKRSNIKVFTKKSKPLLKPLETDPGHKIRNNITTTSMFTKRYARPYSWPLGTTNTPHTHPTTQSNAHITANNKLWFQSLSSSVDINTNQSNIDFV